MSRQSPRQPRGPARWPGSPCSARAVRSSIASALGISGGSAGSSPDHGASPFASGAQFKLRRLSAVRWQKTQPDSPACNFSSETSRPTTHPVLQFDSQRKNVANLGIEHFGRNHSCAECGSASCRPPAAPPRTASPRSPGAPDDTPRSALPDPRRRWRFAPHQPRAARFGSTRSPCAMRKVANELLQLIDRDRPILGLAVAVSSQGCWQTRPQIAGKRIVLRDLAPGQLKACAGERP